MSWLRRLGLALLLALLVGLAIGTWLRLRLEERPRYLGHAEPLEIEDGPADSSFAVEVS